MRKYLLGALFALGSLFALAQHSAPALADTSCPIYGTAATAVMLNPGIPILWCDGNNFLDVNVQTGTVTVNAGTGWPSLTSAGTSGANTLTVQGSASGVPIPVTGTFSTTTTFPYGVAVGSQVSSSSSFIGIAGFDGTYVEPLKVSSNGTLAVSGTFSPSGTFTVGGSNGIVSQDSSNYVNVHCQVGCGTQPYSAATAQPTAAASFAGAGGVDASGKFEPLSVTSAGALNIAGSITAATTFPYSVAYGNTLVANSMIAEGLWNVTTGYVDAAVDGAAGTSITAGTKGVEYVQGIGPNGSFPISASTPLPVTAGIYNGANQANVDSNGNLITFAGSEQVTPAAWTATAQTLTISNTGGAQVMAIDIPAISAGSGSLQVTEDDGGGNYQWQPICTRNDSFQATTGSLTLSTTNAYSWVCNVSPHSSIKLTLTDTGSPSSFTTPYTLGQGPVNNQPRGATATLRGTSGAASATFCTQTAAATITSTTDTTLVAVASSKTLYVCSINVSSTVSTSNLLVQEGTNAGCSTGTITAGTQQVTMTSTPFLPEMANGLVMPSIYQGALCATAGGTLGTTYVSVVYDQY